MTDLEILRWSGTRADGVQVLRDEPPPMDLPPGARINPDNSVTLSLDHPFDLKVRSEGSSALIVEHFDELVLRRLSGAEARRVVHATNTVRAAMSLSLGITLKKLILIENLIDARDEAAARDVVSELLGGLRMELPPYAEITPTGIRLPIFRPVLDEHGLPDSNILFGPITGAQRQRIAHSPSILDWGIATSLGISPKVAKSLVDALDGADVMAMNAVVMFLCGSFRDVAR